MALLRVRSGLSLKVVSFHVCPWRPVCLGRQLTRHLQESRVLATSWTSCFPFLFFFPFLSLLSLSLFNTKPAINSPREGKKKPAFFFFEEGFRNCSAPYQTSVSCQEFSSRDQLPRTVLPPSLKRSGIFSWQLAGCLVLELAPAAGLHAFAGDLEGVLG